MSDRLDNNESLILASGERSRMIQRYARDSQDKRRARNEKNLLRFAVLTRIVCLRSLALAIVSSPLFTPRAVCKSS